MTNQLPLAKERDTPTRIVIFLLSLGAAVLSGPASDHSVQGCNSCWISNESSDPYPSVVGEESIKLKSNTGPDLNLDPCKGPFTDSEFVGHRASASQQKC